MGGGYYDRDVGETSSAGFGDLSFTDDAKNAMVQKSLHTDLDPLNRSIKCTNNMPLVVAMDVTRSRGDDSKILYDKVPMLFGQIMMHNYLEDPAISFAAIGDATSDNAPIQICDFDSGKQLDDWLTKIWLEEGGGGTGQESYELLAYYYARHCELPDGKKGLFFITGDEGYYPQIPSERIKNVFGDSVSSLNAIDVYKELQEKFDVYFLFPKKGFDVRKADINAEIMKRLAREGGKSGDVHVSLIWQNRNDLDIHVIAPSGEEIFYGRKKSKCGGELDVDMNVRGESMQPVENIYWKRSGAPIGKYKVFVQNYGYNGEFTGKTNYIVSISINGVKEIFEGFVEGTGEQSNKTIKEFEYLGVDNNSQEDPYENYNDDVIMAQWNKIIPEKNIIRFPDSKAVIDIMLGITAVKYKGISLEEYKKDMEDRLQSEERILMVMDSLKNI